MEKLSVFLNILETLLPTNNILEAMAYSMIWSLKDTIENDYIKMEMLIKKLIGEENLV